MGIENMPLPELNSCTVAVIGLGYVGLPLAIEFSKQQPCCLTSNPLRRTVIGFDIDVSRLNELRAGFDRTKEVDDSCLTNNDQITFTNDQSLLAVADVFIVTVPTPIDQAKNPDFRPLETASATVGKALKKRTSFPSKSLPVVIFESTVYPGATQEVCIPILETESDLLLNKDFFVGYSPERINPGDSERKIASIVKVTSGSTPESTSWIDKLYASIISAGTYSASSIQVAEAAKVIENTQRDLNIALINELAIIFHRLGIDTLDVIEASATKWNFLPFKPGLVGGHCIGVDPYYLTYKSEQVGYHPQVVLAGRRINDSMSHWVVEQLVLELSRRRMAVGGSSLLVLGLSFKENCPDIRNTRVYDLVKAASSYGINPVVVDPFVDPQQANDYYSLVVTKDVPTNTTYSAIIVAVAHDNFKMYTEAEWLSLMSPDAVVFDLKGIVPRSISTFRL